MSDGSPQTQNDLELHLKEQLEFLEAAGEAYDEGDYKQSKLIALHVRTLLHDTSSSYSLLRQLGLKQDTLFYDTSSTPSNVMETYTGLVLKGVGPDGASYIPPLDELPPNQISKRIAFDEYWSNPIFKYAGKKVITRRELVLAVANQDGGAHVDPHLQEWYADLIKNNSIGWIYGNGKSDEPQPIGNPSLSAIRQIGHEVLKTLIPNYPEKRKLSKHKDTILMGEIYIQKGFTPGVMVAPNLGKKISRNSLCPCESGKKWKRCGYLETEEHKSLTTRQ